MKYWAIISASGAALVLFSNPIFAVNGVTPHGAHHTVNIIGHPNLKECESDDCDELLGGNGASSGGSALFIPLVTEKRPRNMESEFACTSDGGPQTKLVDDEVPSFTTEAPDGKTRIYFKPVSESEGFKIIDRVADKDGATIQVPVSDDDQYITLDLWIRVLGKKGTCAEISGYAEDVDSVDSTLWWYSGSVMLNREAKRSEFVYANDLFDVWYCDVEEILVDGVVVGYQCMNNTEQELSVFDDAFKAYFWDVRNYGTRLIQMRFYYRSNAVQ